MKQQRPSARDAVIEAAFDLFSRDPSASISEVAAAAGVGRATLHRHFAGRADLVLALANIATEELNEAVKSAVAGAPSWTEALRLSMGAIIPLADRNWFLAQEPLEHHPDIAAAHAAQQAELVEAIDEARKEGAFAPEVPTSWIAAAYDTLIYAGWQAVREGDLTPAQAADLAWRTLAHGLKGETT